MVHPIRNSLKYCACQDLRKVVKALKPIYTAPTIDAAADALDAFDTLWGARYPAIAALWRNSWERFVPPFLAFHPAIRKITKTRATSQPRTPCSRSSTSRSAASATTAEENSAPTPKAGDKHSTLSPSPSPGRFNITTH